MVLDGIAHTIPADCMGKVVVWQRQIDSLNGGMVEVPNTHQMQTYEPAYFDKLYEAGFFSESKMKVDVLHDPRKA